MNPLFPEIREITEIIVREYSPDKIILFGSRARGDSRPDSDIDILVVSDREKVFAAQAGAECAVETGRHFRSAGHSFLYTRRFEPFQKYSTIILCNGAERRS